jgi:hypothetical protein
MRLAIATFAGMPTDFEDDRELVELLRARGAEVELWPWDGAHDWRSRDLVVVRTTWDYTWKLTAFQHWLRTLPVPLENAPALQIWNSDKHYLADLAAAGIPTVPTRFVAPGDALPALHGEVVIKPSVSAGGRHTGRFGPSSHDAARALLHEITASGRTAMLQPYVASVERAGETAVVVIDGAVSHVLRKGAILDPDEVAPLRGDDLGAAEKMYDPNLVRASSAQADELALAERVLAFVERRFATRPLFARVDMLRSADGTPVLLELEAIEPSLYTTEAPGSAARLAEAILRRARQARSSAAGARHG